MILAWIGAALAEPAALRTSLDAAVDVGPTVSAAADVGRASIACWGRLDGGSAGLAVGSHRRQGWLRVDGWVGGEGLLVVPGVALAVGGAVGIAHELPNAAGRLQVVAPLTLALAPVLVPRLPVTLEGAYVRRVGPVWIGGRGGVGTIVNPYRSSIQVSGGLVVGYRRPS